MTKEADLSNLPALDVEVTGSVTHSNVDAFRTKALDAVKAINTDLTKEEDFAQAEQDIKWCKKLEQLVEDTKTAALDQTASIRELLDQLSDISEHSRKKRLHLGNHVKDRKQEIKDAIKRDAQIQFEEHVGDLIKSISTNVKGGIQIETAQPDFAGAVKGKKTLDSMQKAVNAELDKVRHQATERAEEYRGNLETLTRIAGKRRELFSDWRELIAMHPDALEAEAHRRIERDDERKRRQAEAEEAERNRKAEAAAEAERERIRAEEQAKARREAEEQAKAQHEAERAASVDTADKGGHGQTGATPEESKHDQENEAHSERASAENPSVFEDAIKQWAVDNQVDKDALGELFDILNEWKLEVAA